MNNRKLHNPVQFSIRKLSKIFLSAVVLACSAIGMAQAQSDLATVGRWSLGPNLPFFPVHTHMLPTGQVMMWPGDERISGDDPRAWDPATGTLTPLQKTGYDLFCTGHSFLADGRLLVTGGTLDYAFTGFAKASTYDPFTDSWSAVSDMNAGRWYPTNTTLANGDVLVVSGQINPTLGENILPQVFQTATGTWRNLTNAQLSLDLYPRMHLAPNGKVFTSGMNYQSRYLDTSGTGSWTFVANMSRSRAYGTSVMYDAGKVLAVGGADPPVNTAEVIDLNSPSPAWRLVDSMDFARRQLNATDLPDGRVLVTGGTSGPGFNNATTPVYAAEMWNPSTETFTRMASASIPRLYHSAVVLLPDGRLLSTGGNGYPQSEIYEPPYLFKGARPTISSSPTTNITYGQTFFIGTPDAAGITQVTWIRLSSTTHAFNMEQRFSRLSFSPAAGGLNVVAPSSANLSPPGYYMLFILNGNGVPSVAKIIQILPSGTNPVPVASSLSPSSGTAGGTAFTLTVNGSGFISNSVVRWNGSNRTTTFVSSTQLTASIQASDITTVGTAQVTVFNPTPGGGTSNALTFTINSATGPVGLVAAYSFNEGTGSTVADASGNNNIGSINGAAWTTQGRFGNALYFDGINDWMTVNDSNSLDLTTGMTLEAWVNPTSSAASWTTVLMKEQASTQAYALFADTTSARPYIYFNTATDSSGSKSVGGTSALPINTWSHLAATYDNTTLRLYVNGVQVGSQSFTGSIMNSAAALRIGGNSVWGEYFQGRIDELRIYNRALTQSEIQADMNTPIGGTAAPGTLQFSSATYSVNENGANASITVTRTGGSSGAVGASFSTSNGTATAGSDYTTTTQTVSFADGDTANKTVTIPILDDTTFEGNETVNLALTSPSGGATLGSPSTAVLTITDDESAPAGTLQFSSVTYSVNENSGNATITVTRTGGSAGAVGVTFSTSNGTASAGSDYTTTNQTVTFNDGDVTDKAIIVPITDDTAFEENETVNLTLSSPTGGATLGNPSAAVLTISDNEAPNPVPSLSSMAPINATAGGPAFTLTVNGSGFVSGSVVRWNDSSRTTTFVGSAQITAAIPASDITTAGSAQITVFNPAPGGGNSNALTFTIDPDTTAPDTNITNAPANPTNSSTASFSFSSTEAGSFQCQIDAGGFIACTSSQTYNGLTSDSHTFEVRAVDGAGNTDPTPATYTWIIDTIAPDTTITGNPPNPSNNGNASFTFIADESATFQCRLDGNPFTACTSPQSYANLSIGNHTFEVRAIDSVGNVDPTPATYIWTYTPITSTPSAVTIEMGTPRAGSFASLNADDNDYFEVNSTTSGTRTATWYGVFSAVPSGLQNLRITYKGKHSRNNSQVVAIWRWATSSWVQLDNRKVSTTEIEIANLVPPGDLTAYVNGGQMRIRVTSIGSGSQSFFTSGDLLKIVYDVP